MSRKLILHYVHRFFIPLMVLAALLLVLMPTSVVRADDVVTFPDPNLEAAIREAINKPSGDIYQSDLDGLTSISAYSSGIAVLTGLEHCTSLTYLGLNYNQISDLSPLAGLTNLTGLDLYQNQIGDLSPLAGLTNLYWLVLDQNQISDLSPLAGLTNLSTLTLGSTQISDISPLTGLTKLTYLYLNSNQISDISPLAGLTNLPWLRLDQNQITDISPLAGLTNLTWLLLDQNQISDLSPLAGLTNLSTLTLGSNQISNLSPLTGLTNLTYLDLYGNQVSNISPLSGLTHLSYLEFGDNQISDISVFAGLTNLWYLDLVHNQISDISALAGLTNLTSLGLYGNPLSDISPLSGLTNLWNLYLGDNQIINLSPLAGLTNLTNLNLPYNQVSDLSPLSGLTSLTNLNLYWNQVSDLSPLAGLTNLSDLRLGYNQISDLSPLSGLTSLVYLTLDYNQMSDIQPLVSNPGVGSGDYLSLDGNPLNDTSVNVYIPQLEARGVQVVWSGTAYQPPSQPSNISPVNSATGISLTPTLQSSAFSDPDAGDAQAASQWQVTITPGDYSSSVFDSGTDTSNLTSLAIPSGTLTPNTTYYWHVRHQDNHGAWSNYSAETSFTTAAAQVETATSTGTAGFTPAMGTIENLVAVPESSLPTEGKPDIQFPHGLFEFEITGLTLGQSVTLTITLPSAVPDDAQYWKYGPTPSDSNPHWYQIPWTRISSNTISITLADGGLGDDDLVADGTIIDQGGPGWPGPSGGEAHSAPVFPSIYIGIGAALGAGILAYFVRRRLAS